MIDPLQLVMEERARQDRKWGVQNHVDFYWLPILLEEIGELSEAILLKYNDEPERPIDPLAVRNELVEVCAVALAWLEALHRRETL